MHHSNVFALPLRSAALTALLLACGAFALGCADLSDRCLMGTEGCACRPADDPGGRCQGQLICAAGTCFAQGAYSDPLVCHNACVYQNDGVCQDSVDTPASGACAYGADCSDCGVRPNRCPTNRPVYCPQRIAGAEQCFPPGIDCLTVRTCAGNAMPGPFACPMGQAVDCGANGACVNVSTGTCSPNAPTVCVSEGACVPKFADCNSLAQCNGAWGACYYGETYMCTPTGPTCQGPSTP